MTAARIEIGAFPMVRDAAGARDVTFTEIPDFWDVIVSRPDHATGIVEVIECHDDLTTAEAFDGLATVEAKYLGAGGEVSDSPTAAAPDPDPRAANLTEGRNK